MVLKVILQILTLVILLQHFTDKNWAFL